MIPERFDMARMSMETLGSLVNGENAAIVLLPVGSTEPHGPHLPLATDTVISVAACVRAAELLDAGGRAVVIAPSVPYGVTECAAGFPGAVSVSSEALVGFLTAVINGLHENGFNHVCLVNNHLEPEHDAAVRQSIANFNTATVSVASPLTRKWARTLSDEFKSGECHAGRYETSIVMAADASLVNEELRKDLPEVPISLSEKLSSGVNDFRSMGLENAYSGDPAQADAEHGSEQTERLAEMIVGEIDAAMES